jgi:hypothetical protein
MGSENSVPDTAHILLIPGSLCCHDWVEDLVRHSRRLFATTALLITLLKCNETLPTP